MVMSIDPEDIVVTPNGAILFKGEDLRPVLSGERVSERGVNWACGNKSCGSSNVQCFDDIPLLEAINIGFCSIL
jgi:hypothetical protein